MSDKQQLEQAAQEDGSKNTEKSTEKSADTKPAKSTSEMPAKANKAEKAEKASKPEKQAKQQKQAKQAKVGLLWFFVLITLAVSGAAGYGVYLLSKQTDEATVSQGDLLEQSQTAIIDLRSDLSDVEGAVQDETEQRQAATRNADEKLELLSMSIEKQARHIKELSASNRDQWLLAEVEYLLRLANQRILMSRDSAGALSMLDSADHILQGIDDVSLHVVRKSIADDLASLRGVEPVDIDGTYLQLAALADQIETLELYDIPQFDISESESEFTAEQEPQVTMKERLSKAWQAMAAALEKVFVIRRNSETVEAMVAPQDELYLRQNLRLMIEQAQLALLSTKPAIYQKSLEKTQRWIAQYFLMDHKSTQAALQSLSDLAALDINPGLPDISGSFRALKKYQQGQLNSRPGLDYVPEEQPEQQPEQQAEEQTVPEQQAPPVADLPEPAASAAVPDVEVETNVELETDVEAEPNLELEMEPAEAVGSVSEPTSASEAE